MFDTMAKFGTAVSAELVVTISGTHHYRLGCPKLARKQV